MNLDNGDFRMTTSVKRYFRTGREGTDLLAAIRRFLQEELNLYRECAVYQKSGGRSGDLGEEVMEYEEWMQESGLGLGGSFGGGGVVLYSVVDHTANGYAHLFSVIIALPEKGALTDRLLAFLDEHDFVAKYRSFADRPLWSHHYCGYLDEWLSLPNLHGAFKYREAPTKKAA